MNKMTIPPDQSGYSVTDGNEVVATKLDGGASRYRRDILGATSTVTVQWSVGPDVYRYLRAFYKTATANGSSPFLIDLLLDEPSLTEHKAYFVPGSMRLQSQKGLQYVVAAQLEVTPDLPDTAYDEAIVLMYEEYGTDAPAFLNQLEQLANVDLPGALY
tara:strand:+ start:471 stop:947 length:477 start_codon:yes stop_codon:yes gene_type:complete